MPATDPDPRLHTSLVHLRGLERGAKGLRFLARQPAASVLNGRHASRLRGRGMNFEDLRHYLPGDDIRSIDWKVTARTGKPHVRVYTEERDRPALLLVDQRMSMFFGSVLNMKSVTAAEAAALAAFAVLAQGDRIGGVVFTDDSVAELRPQRSRKALTRFLASVAEANMALSADRPVSPPQSLNTPLEAALRLTGTGGLVLVFSDFDGMDDATEALVRALAKKCDLVLVTVLDPIAAHLPKNLRIVVSDGALQAEINAGDGATRTALEAFTSQRLSRLMDMSRKYGVPVLPLLSDQATLPQMRRLLGHDRGRP